MELKFGDDVVDALNPVLFGDKIDVEEGELLEVW